MSAGRIAEIFSTRGPRPHGTSRYSSRRDCSIMTSRAEFASTISICNVLELVRDWLEWFSKDPH